MFPRTPRLFGDAGAPYNSPSCGFQHVHIGIQTWGKEPDERPFVPVLMLGSALKQLLVQTFLPLLYPPFRTVSFQPMADSHVRPLGGVMYVN